ncbi:MAG TPA: hypothetical protein VF550_17475 [Polyangia bacterium]
MKKLLVLGISALALAAAAGSAQATDTPARQEGRVWIDQNFVLAFSPNWSLTTMPGARSEYARSREGAAGLQLLELFFGPNYTYRTGNWTIKGSLWYYYMGYPQRGREVPGKPTASDCSIAPMGSSPYCTSTYNASHNLEIIPSVEYRWGRWSIYDRVILHNTIYADVYSTPNPTLNLSVADQRLGWGTVLRELVQGRFAVTDRLGVSVMDELFLGIIEDGDTSKIADGKGYIPTGYWKQGFRANRVYLGIDYKVTPNFILAPMYMVEVMMNATDSTDVTDIAHTLFVVATVTAAIFGNK